MQGKYSAQSLENRLRALKRTYAVNGGGEDADSGSTDECGAGAARGRIVNYIQSWCGSAGLFRGLDNGGDTMPRSWSSSL
ncbi:hypothetical protein PC118_g5515 [Phytophthora cactorum]|uniref:Uncharacterized protein n=1 Tax=Phytophthora cactorum TaxID=29920 RepID=A0A8T1GBC2_9STRA|nr:hypothetical protein PC118_g5515 [Phytophthora cactorum]